MKFFIAVLGLVIFSQSNAQNRPNQMNVSDAEQLAIIRMRQNGGNLSLATAGGFGGGCFGSLMSTVSQGMQNSFQAQTEEANMLMGLAKEYYEHEQSCKNELAQIMMEHNTAQAKYQEEVMQLPNKIEAAQIEYEMAVLEVQQQCEQTSGALFQQWKTAQETGVVSDGLGALIGRQGKINSFQKLFYDDCIVSNTNATRVNLLGRKLANKVRTLKTEVEAYGNSFNAQTENMSFRQGVVEQNCIDGERMIDYKRTVAQNNANTNNTMAQTNNFLNAIGGIAQCMGGTGNRSTVTGNPDATGAQQ